MARLVGNLQGFSYMESSQYAMPAINAQLGVEWPGSTVQIPLNWGLSSTGGAGDGTGNGTGDGTGEGSGDCSVKSMGSEFSTLALFCRGQPPDLPFRSCEMGVPVLRSGTRVPNSPSQLRKFSQRIQKCCGMVWQQNALFA
ncbi:hypothetical protein CK203_103102 [Vitis vinifera]|uniref:Uncharacterized protein n=1 Tax=Vitis vinifera TaxID=29760 RepID=A0A438CVQ9_VITVI|nr:hypothetical protein CK203_103102 [Vitis vinifera]